MLSRSSAAVTPSTVLATDPSSFWAGITTESFMPSAMRPRRYRKSRIRCEVTPQFFVSARLSSQPKRCAILMAVAPMPREKWTDERLDDLQDEMHRGFADLRTEIADTKTEMRAGFARVDADIRELRREMRAGFFVIVAAIIGSNATLIASNAF